MATATHKKTSAGIKGRSRNASRGNGINRARGGAKDAVLDQINKRFAKNRQKRHKAAEANAVKLFGKTHL